MAKYTREDILHMAEEEDVEFIRLQFTDMFGTMKNIAIPFGKLEKAMDNECVIDASSMGASIETKRRICTSTRIWILSAFFHGDPSRER